MTNSSTSTATQNTGWQDSSQHISKHTMDNTHTHTHTADLLSHGHVDPRVRVAHIRASAEVKVAPQALCVQIDFHSVVIVTPLPSSLKLIHENATLKNSANGSRCLTYSANRLSTIRGRTYRLYSISS